MVSFARPTLWYENEQGDQYEPTYLGYAYAPSGYKYQHARFPNELNEHVLRVENGSSELIWSGTATWPEDLVNAMVRSGEYGACDAILLCGVACERCLNAIGNMYGMAWGYPAYSIKWQQSNTRCELCTDKITDLSLRYIRFSQVRRPSGWFLIKSRLKEIFWFLVKSRLKEIFKRV